MKRDNKMVVKADAKAMGAVTAHEARVAPRWQASKGDARKPHFGTKGDCYSYKRNADGTIDLDSVKLYKPTRTKRSKGSKPTSEAKRIVEQQQADRLAKLAAIGNNSDAD